MALSSVTYTATPGQTAFPVTFHLPVAEDLVVTVDLVELAITTDWTINAANTVVTLVVPAAGGETVVLQRVTSLLDADLPVTFTQGAAITKANLDDSVHDLNHKIQELADNQSDVTGPQGPPGPPGDDGAPGLVWRGPWDSGTSYDAPDAVEFGGSSWVALGPSLNSQPDSNPSDWDLLAQKGDDGTSGVGDEMLIFMGL
jgi:hypothetical protein